MKWLLASAAMFVGMMLGLIMIATAALSGSALGSQGYFPINVKVGDIPPAYLALYRQAAVATGIDWAILAAIGEVETQHGRAQGSSCAVSTKGARGPMQFMPATWANYGAGGDICDPVDAIPAAARYLVASGAPRDYHAAILSYNHSEVYYQDVTSVAQRYRRRVAGPSPRNLLPMRSSHRARRRLDPRALPRPVDGVLCTHGPRADGGAPSWPRRRFSSGAAVELGDDRSDGSRSRMARIVRL
jgi:soluble lytic murein transglycosylase-like protein